jgi:hypothetical protein
MAAQILFDGLDERKQMVVLDLLNILSNAPATKGTKASSKHVKAEKPAKAEKADKPVSEKKAEWSATLARCRAILTEQCGTVSEKTGKKTFKQGDVMRVASAFKESSDKSDERIVQLWRELETNPTPAKRALKKAAKETASVVEEEELIEETTVEVPVVVEEKPKPKAKVVLPPPLPVEEDEEEGIETERWLHNKVVYLRTKKAPYFCFDIDTQDYLGVFQERTGKFDMNIPDPRD